MSHAERAMLGCLMGVVVGLLLVGLAGGTPIRHVIQAFPAVLAIVVVVKRAPWSSFAALPIFLFWFLIMLLIWLWLLGLASVITGHFTRAETALTIVIGGSSVAGVVHAVRSRSGSGRLARLLAFLSFAVLQVTAMWLSLQPMVSTR